MAILNFSPFFNRYGSLIEIIVHGAMAKVKERGTS